MSPSPPLPELLSFALELAAAAEGEILPRFRACAASRKADGSEVTEADREAERVMRVRIAARYPSHGILGEELGPSAPSGTSYRWILDPIDGTASFVLGLPVFGTLVALVDGDEPLLGVIHMPALGETVWGARNLGAWYRRGSADAVRIRVAAPLPLAEARVSLTGVHGSPLRPEGRPALHDLSGVLRGAGALRFVGDCVQHALVCQGLLHAAIDPIMKPWDIAALVPCVEEAGGVAASLSGQREGILDAGSLVTACDAGLLREIVAAG